MTLAKRTLSLGLASLATLGCSNSSGSVTGSASSQGPDTEDTLDTEADDSGSTGEPACAPLELLEPGEQLPDGQTLASFRDRWAGSYTAGLDWGWAVDGVAPAAFQGITEATLEVDVAFAQRLYENCEEVATEVESEVTLSTADGALDEVWQVRWSYDGETWESSLSLPVVQGALTYDEIGGEAPVTSLEVDLLLQGSGALAVLLYAQGMADGTVRVNGLAAVGGVRSPEACSAFHNFAPSCLPAGCAQIEAVPVVLDEADACACLEPQALCLATTPEAGPPQAYSLQLEGQTRVFVAPYELPANAGFAGCTAEDDPACGCVEACG